MRAFYASLHWLHVHYRIISNRFQCSDILTGWILRIRSEGFSWRFHIEHCFMLNCCFNVVYTSVDFARTLLKVYLKRCNINLFCFCFAHLPLLGYLQWTGTFPLAQWNISSRLFLQLLLTWFDAALVPSSLWKPPVSAKPLLELITEFVRCVGGLC